MNNYYVYAYIDPKLGKVRYVGKGRNKRIEWWRHAKPSEYGVCSWLFDLKQNGLEPITLKILEELTEKEAFYWEKNEIQRLGRRTDGGTLMNLSSGGEGTSNYPPSEITRAKRSKAMRGHTVTTVTRKKLSKAAEKQWSNPISRKQISQALRNAEPQNEFKGISHRKGKWATRIYIKGVRKHLGCYSTPEEAAYAYNIAVDFEGIGYKNSVVLSEEKEQNIRSKVEGILCAK